LPSEREGQVKSSLFLAFNTGTGRTKALTRKPPSLGMRRELSYLCFHQPFLFCLLDRRWILKTQGRKLFCSVFIFIPPMVGRGIRLFKSSCQKTKHSISEPSALLTSRIANLHWHQFYFTFKNLWQLGVLKVFPEISTLKLNHIHSA